MKKRFIAIAGGAFLSLAFISTSFAITKSEGYNLIKANGCLACHSVDQNKVGPSYKIVAQRNIKLYGKDAIKHIEKAIEKGSKGKFKDLGITAVMPPYGYLGKQKIEIIAKWILKQAK